MDKEKFRAYQKKYAAANAEKIRERNKLWREKNRDRINQYSREYNKANRLKRVEIERRYRANHPEEDKAKYVRRLRGQQEYLNDLLLEGCIECGISDVRVLQFDHVPERGVKKFKISSTGFKPWRSFLEELAKCDVVCANCHAIRTYDRLLLAGSVPFREAIRARNG